MWLRVNLLECPCQAARSFDKINNILFFWPSPTSLLTLGVMLHPNFNYRDYLAAKLWFIISTTCSIKLIFSDSQYLFFSCLYKVLLKSWNFGALFMLSLETFFAWRKHNKWWVLLCYKLVYYKLYQTVATDWNHILIQQCVYLQLLSNIKKVATYNCIRNTFQKQNRYLWWIVNGGTFLRIPSY